MSGTEQCNRIRKQFLTLCVADITAAGITDKDLECLLEGVLTCLELSPWSDSPARAAQAARGRTWRRSAPLGAGGEGG